MVRLDGSREKIIYTTDSNASPPEAKYVDAKDLGILLIDCFPAMIDRFDHQRGNLSRREYLDELLDLAEGIGEVVY